MLPRYDTSQTYAWNYEHAPDVPAENPPGAERDRVPGEWDFCGLPVASPLGIAAGPLLNGRWVLYYARLGFDVLTYKTVRSVQRACYPLPNLQPVAVRTMSGRESHVPAATTVDGSWAVSFGMPSRPPDVWRADVEATRRALPSGKLLCVSVVGTMQPGWTIDDLAEDYARCARWAADSGAHAVEANFSCPNVATCDGQLFQDPAAAKVVAARVRQAVPGIPLVVKIGHVPEESAAAALVEALEPHADALSMTNCLAARVVSAEGNPLFDGQPRGIGGQAIHRTSVEQVRRFARLIRERGSALRTIGVGGARTAEDVQAYLDAGAHAVHLATAAMVDPEVGRKIRAAMRETATASSK